MVLQTEVLGGLKAATVVYARSLSSSTTHFWADVVP